MFSFALLAVTGNPCVSRMCGLKRNSPVPEPPGRSIGDPSPAGPRGWIAPHSRRSHAGGVVPRPSALTEGDRFRPESVIGFGRTAEPTSSAAAASEPDSMKARILWDWLVVGQVLPVNPAAAARGPTHVVTS